jgi:hypothetical protein
MPFILETIVITQDENGLPNFAPMGVTFEDDEIFLRPYKETTTHLHEPRGDRTGRHQFDR